MPTIPIPGGHAILRDNDDVRERGRRYVRTALMAAAHVYDRIPEDVREKAGGKGPEAEAAQRTFDRLLAGAIKTPEDGEAIFAVHDGAILAVLESWTLQRPLPKTRDELQDLDRDLYDALSEAVAPNQAAIIRAAMGVSFEPTDRKDGEDTPFGGSSGSRSTSSPNPRRVRSSTSTRKR